MQKNQTLIFRNDFVEKFKSLSQNSQPQYKQPQLEQTQVRFYPKRKVNIRDILNSKYTKEIILMFKKFRDYGYIVEEKKHYFYIERVKHYIQQLQNYFTQFSGYIEPVLIEQLRDLLIEINNFYNNIDFSKSEKGLFIPCVNSKLYKTGEFLYDETVCPICAMNSIQRIIDKFTLYSNNSENSLLEIEKQLELYEESKDLKFTTKEKDLLTVLNDLDKLFSTFKETYITLTNIYLPIVGFIPHINSEDNDIMNINNYQYYILVFNNENELNNFIKPIVDYLTTKGTSLKDIEKLVVYMKIEEFEDEQGNTIKQFVIPEPDEDIFVDYEVETFVNNVIDYSKQKGYIPQQLQYENTIFYRYLEELNFNTFHKSLYNPQKHQIMLDFIKHNLTQKVEQIFESLNLNLEKIR
jgi:hypothetical protein